MKASECIREIQRIIADAWLHSTATLTYYDPDVQPALNVVRKRYPEFVGASETAHIGQAVVLLYSLLESRADTANFKQLVELLKEEGLVTDKISGLKSNLKQAKLLWVKVCILRNEVIGHRSQKRTREESFSKANLTPRNLMDLTVLFKDAINAVTLARDNTSWSPLMDVGPNLRAVISILAAKRQR
jgi:hypothetical protein